MPIKLRVLIIDSDPAARQLILRALVAAEVEASALDSGRQAVELVGREKFDGIFVDWAISDVPARELVTLIRRSKFNYAAPIIAMATENERQAFVESFKEGVTFFLGKPLSAGKVHRLLTVSRGLILEERRQFQRALVALPVECRHQHDEVKGTSVDLSARGVLVSAARLYAAETDVQLRFKLTSGGQPTVETSGRVVRVTPEKQMEIRFLGLSPKERREIAEFVEKVLEKQQPASKL